MTIFSEVLIFAAFWLFAVLSTLFYMHMFQLNSYRADKRQRKRNRLAAIL